MNVKVSSRAMIYKVAMWNLGLFCFLSSLVSAILNLSLGLSWLLVLPNLVVAFVVGISLAIPPVSFAVEWFVSWKNKKPMRQLSDTVEIICNLTQGFFTGLACFFFYLQAQGKVFEFEKEVFLGFAITAWVVFSVHFLVVVLRYFRQKHREEVNNQKDHFTAAEESGEENSSSAPKPKDQIQVKNSIPPHSAIKEISHDQD